MRGYQNLERGFVPCYRLPREQDSKLFFMDDKTKQRLLKIRRLLQKNAPYVYSQFASKKLFAKSNSDQAKAPDAERNGNAITNDQDKAMPASRRISEAFTRSKDSPALFPAATNGDTPQCEKPVKINN